MDISIDYADIMMIYPIIYVISNIHGSLDIPGDYPRSTSPLAW
jgi:hypothetical protein